MMMRDPNLKKVLTYQKNAAKFMSQATECFQNSVRAYGEHQETFPDEAMEKLWKPSKDSEVAFVLEKISERHVEKYNANSCVFRARMENDEPKNVNYLTM